MTIKNKDFNEIQILNIAIIDLLARHAGIIAKIGYKDTCNERN